MTEIPALHVPRISISYKTMRLWIWLFLAGELVMLRVRGMALQKAAYSHPGLCPNDVNPNLWVDAMSTCTRECESDQVSASPFFVPL